MHGLLCRSLCYWRFCYYGFRLIEDILYESVKRKGVYRRICWEEFSSCGIRRAFIASSAVMFLCMFSVCCHKVYVLHEWSSGIQDFLHEHKADFRNKPSKIFVYFIKDIPEEGYSVYWYTPGHSVAFGEAFLSLWEWKPEFHSKHLNSEDDIDFMPDSLPEYDTVFSLTESGKLKVLRN